MAKLVPDLDSEDAVPDSNKEKAHAKEPSAAADDDSLDIEGGEPAEEGGGDKGVESKSVEERRKAVVFENKVRLVLLGGWNEEAPTASLVFALHTFIRA